MIYISMINIIIVVSLDDTHVTKHLAASTTSDVTGATGGAGHVLRVVKRMRYFAQKKWISRN